MNVLYKVSERHIANHICHLEMKIVHVEKAQQVYSVYDDPQKYHITIVKSNKVCSIHDISENWKKGE